MKNIDSGKLIPIVGLAAIAIFIIISVYHNIVLHDARKKAQHIKRMANISKVQFITIQNGEMNGHHTVDITYQKGTDLPDIIRDDGQIITIPTTSFVTALVGVKMKSIMVSNITENIEFILD